MKVTVQVSVGELLDKMTILEIKSHLIANPQKLQSIHHELEIVKQAWHIVKPADIDVAGEIAELKQINQTLWYIEDDIRIKESKQEFDEHFIELARSVYINNDKRAAVKHQINTKLGSDIVEEKSYEHY